MPTLVKIRGIASGSLAIEELGQLHGNVLHLPGGLRLRLDTDNDEDLAGIGRLFHALHGAVCSVQCAGPVTMQRKSTR